MAAIMTGIVASAFSNQVARKKAAFEAQLREIYADGDMTEEEQASLKRLQAHYRLSDEQVDAMLKRAQLEAFKSKKP
jgi:voltage-gated potassium channel